MIDFHSDHPAASVPEGEVSNKPPSQFEDKVLKSPKFKSVTLIVDVPGPLLLQLKMHPTRNGVVVNGFHLDSDGAQGCIQRDGRVQAGDILVDINGHSLEYKSFKEILQIIRNEGKLNQPRVLTFIRFENEASELRYFGGKHLLLRDQCFSTKESAEDRSKYIESLLYADNGVPMATLRAMSVQGLPDHGSLRCTVWKLLLRYLPPNHKEWDEYSKKRRVLYYQLRSEFALVSVARSGGSEDHFYHLKPSPSFPGLGDAPVAPEEETTEASAYEDMHAVKSSADSGDHGYMAQKQQGGEEYTYTKASSIVLEQDDTNDFYLHEDAYTSLNPEDRELLESIRKDVARTYPELEMFALRETKFAITRVLYTYGKLNGGVKYIQGMNELVGTLYYAFMKNESTETDNLDILQAAETDSSELDNVEADTFFCFTTLMSEFQDFFINTLDNSSCGLQGLIDRFSNLVRAYDPHLFYYLTAQGLEPTFYSVRWITTLFAREFDLPDTCRLWDALLADSNKHDFICCMCFTMLTEIRDNLFTAEFGEALKMLQSYPLKDIPHLLERLREFRAHLVRYPPERLDPMTRHHWYFTEGGPGQKPATEGDKSLTSGPFHFANNAFSGIDPAKIQNIMSKSFSNLVASATKALSVDGGGGPFSGGERNEAEETDNAPEDGEKALTSGRKWPLQQLSYMAKFIGTT